MPIVIAAAAGAVHAIKWQLQHRYMPQGSMNGLGDEATSELPQLAA